jgi:uncharacterized protein YjbI with pentapeptide repeats
MNIYTTNNHLIREGKEETMREALRNAIDSGISLRCAKLSYSYFIEFDFSRSDLSGANFNHSYLSGSKFSNSCLCDTSFYRAYLKSIQIDNTDLSRADLSGANLSEADLSEAKLIGANLSSANLSYANLSGADLKGANLRDADLSSADLSGANLIRADLNGADLSNANLSGANLIGANFRCSIGLYIPETGRSMQLHYKIVLVGDSLFIGCRHYKLHKWFAFSEKTIHKMDDGALKWWRENKSMLHAWCEAEDFGIEL